MTPHFDFANILFAGPCNLRCPYCIGRQVDSAFRRNNLHEFPLRNLGKFIDLIRQHQINKVVFTGATTDPQLYRHEARLLSWLRERLPAPSLGVGVRYSLHTNGQLALQKMDVFNRYDQVCISFPSFKPETYRRMTGSSHMPNLAEIIRQAQIPLKISCVLTEHNTGELPEFLDQCRALGVKRVVLRQLYGDTRRWDGLGHLIPVSFYRQNPVYNYDGMEVTYWRFDQTASDSLNLFSDGAISSNYLLTEAKSGSF